MFTECFRAIKLKEALTWFKRRWRCEALTFNKTNRFVVSQMWSISSTSRPLSRVNSNIDPLDIHRIGAAFGRLIFVLNVIALQTPRRECRRGFTALVFTVVFIRFSKQKEKWSTFRLWLADRRKSVEKKFHFYVHFCRRTRQRHGITTSN